MLTERIGAHRQGTGEKVVPEVKAVELCTDSRSSATRCACKQDSPWSLVTAHEVPHNVFMLFATTYANIYIALVSLNTKETKRHHLISSLVTWQKFFQSKHYNGSHFVNTKTWSYVFPFEPSPGLSGGAEANLCFLYTS